MQEFALITWCSSAKWVVCIYLENPSISGAPYCCNRKLAMYIRGRCCLSFPLLRGNCILLCQGQLFAFPAFPYFIFSHNAHKREVLARKRGFGNGESGGISALWAHLSRCSFRFFFLVAPLLCGFCLASGESDVKVTVTPASKSLASFSCSLYGNKCQTSVSPWQSAGEIDFLCRSNGSTLWWGFGIQGSGFLGYRLGHLAISLAQGWHISKEGESHEMGFRLINSIAKMWQIKPPKKKEPSNYRAKQDTK